MKNTLTKLIALTLVAITLFAIALPAGAESRNAQIEYIPTSVTVSGTTVKIEGYFYNGTGYTVSNFTDFVLQLRQDYSLVLEIEFDSLQYFSIAPGGRVNYSFTVTNVRGLNSGYYNCYLNNIYADCSFTYRYRR